MATRTNRIPQRSQGPRRSSSAAPADLERALHDLGVRISHGDDEEVHGWCPGHFKKMGREDRKPSWSVNRVTGYHNCFSCPYQGNFTELVMDMTRNNSPFAAARWIRQYGLNLEKALSLPTWDEQVQVDGRRPATEISEDRLAEFFHAIPEEELADRGLTREACDHFDIRWDADGDCWIIPIRMPDGTLIGWQEKGGTRRRGYFNNVPKRVEKSLTLFGYHQFPEGGRAVLMESPLDVPCMWLSGVEGGLGTMGDSVSAEQMRLVRELTDELVVARDNDEAGWAEARRLRDGDTRAGRPAYRRMFVMSFYTYPRKPYRKDPGECLPDERRRGVRESVHALAADLGGGEPSPSPVRSARTSRRRTTEWSTARGSSSRSPRAGARRRSR